MLPPKPFGLPMEKKIERGMVTAARGYIKPKQGMLGKEWTFDLHEGEDSYISMPVIPTVSTPEDVFGPEVIVLEFNIATQLYVRPSVLECGKGYYLYSAKTKTVTVMGTECIVTIYDLIAVYDSLSPSEWAFVGLGQEQINVKGSVLEGQMVEFGFSGFFGTSVCNPTVGYWIGKCSGYLTKEECEAANCYWWSSDGACHCAPEVVIECDNPTPHFSSGCELLLHCADNDGLINLDELNQSYSDYENGVITEEEFDFVSDAYIYGGVNVVCPGCWEAPPKKTVTFTPVPAGATVTVD
ncbi:unnamed protein product [marine sediment metagenome]|uniref:Uncharacterized protein n=1 Tax=marine sediment metagenome TaxID=412755 RepID=X1DVL3_9ZZZZ